MDVRGRRDRKPPLRAFLLFLDFLKVLRFSFPVPVIRSRSLVHFWRRKHKKSTTRASRSWKNLSSTYRQVYTFPSLRDKRLKEKGIPGAREAQKARDGEARKRVPPPSSLAHGLVGLNALPLTFRTPATQSILFPSPQTPVTQANLRTTNNPSVSKLRSQFKNGVEMKLYVKIE